jgi:hypothetical protein
MNPTIDNIRALAERLQDEAWNDGKSGVARASERTVAAFDTLQAAIEQALGPGAGDGYVLVPVKPTEEMIYAAQVAGHPGDGFDVVDDYEAMLAAAPQPQPQPLFVDLIAQHPGLSEELAEMQAPKQEPVAWQQELTNILCRVHRDGGHYIAEHGWRKAIDDADLKVADLNAASYAPQPQPNATVPALNDADSVDCPRCGHCCPDDTALLMECIGLLMQMPIKHPQQGEYRDDLIRRIRERLK